jgi:antitoxin HicB
MKNRHVGSTFLSFLDEEGIREEVDLRAKKKILADQILAKMERDNVTRTELAERMQTSRTVVNRLLDPNDTSFTFGTLAKASKALDLDLLVSLEARKKEPARRRK